MYRFYPKLVELLAYVTTGSDDRSGHTSDQGSVGADDEPGANDDMNDEHGPADPHNEAFLASPGFPVDLSPIRV